MIDFLKKFFSKNLLIKAFSLVFAFCLWLVVVNQLDPVTNQTIYNVPVTVKNENYFAERDQYVTIESELSVNVTVSGRRSEVEKLSAEDFTATVDYMEADPVVGRGQILSLIHILQNSGQDPYQVTKYEANVHSKQVLEHFETMEGSEVSLAGRLMSKRVMGKASFCHVQDEQGQDVYKRQGQENHEHRLVRAQPRHHDVKNQQDHRRHQGAP